MEKGIKIFLVGVTALTVLLQQGHKPGPFPNPPLKVVGAPRLEAEGCFAGPRSHAPSPSPPSARPPGAAEGQDAFGCPHVAFAGGQQRLLGALGPFALRPPALFARVFLAWGALLPLELWLHERDGALASLLVPQQYLWFSF